jgi:hypothetical protein
MATIDVTAALVRFQDRLEKAQAVTEVAQGPLPPGSIPERWQQQLWIKAVQHLMEDLGLGRFLNLPLAMLEALGDLDRGNLSKILTPAPVANRPPPLMATARTQARAIKILDLMLSEPRASRPSPQAGASMIWKARADWTGIFNSPNAIIELRKSVMKGRATRDIMRLWQMELPADEFGVTPAEQISSLLRLLSEH